MYLGMYLIGSVCVFGFQIVQFGCGVFFFAFPSDIDVAVVVATMPWF